MQNSHKLDHIHHRLASSTTLLSWHISSTICENKHARYLAENPVEGRTTSRQHAAQQTRAAGRIFTRKTLTSHTAAATQLRNSCKAVGVSTAK